MILKAIFFGLGGAGAGAVLCSAAYPDPDSLTIASSIIAGAAAALLLNWLTGARENTFFGKILSSIWPLPTARRQVLGGGPQELDSFEVDYIYDIRMRSYETEIIITIGLYAALLSIDHRNIDDALWTLTWFLPYDTILILSKASLFALWILRLGMSFHLLLRSIWIALVGLGFTYPRGIGNSSLHGALHRRSYKYLTTPDAGSRLTLAIERLCSVVYGVWLSCLFSLMAWTFLILASYGLADMVYGQVELFHTQSTNQYVLMGLFALVIFSAWTYFKTSQRNSLLAFRYPIFDIFHFFRGTFLAYSPPLRFLVVCFPILCILLGVLFTHYQGPDIAKYTYINHLKIGETLNRPALNNWSIDRGYVEIYLPQKYLAKLGLAKKLHDLPQGKKSTLREILEKGGISFYLNETKLTKLEWLEIMLGDARVLSTLLPLEGLGEGVHNLQIMKTAEPGASAQKPINIPFYYFAGKE